MRILSILLLASFCFANTTNANTTNEGIRLIGSGLYQDAYKVLSKVYEQTKDPKAIYYMGFLNKTEFNNYSLGVNQIYKSAQLGYPEAMCEYGILLYKGQKYSLALSWFNKAAKLHSPKAMYLIGWMYEQGVYVGRNAHTANKWYSRAGKAHKELKKQK